MPRKHTTLKTYISRINHVLNYINSNLEEELKLEDLARKAHFSEFHFQRIFKVVVRKTLNTYIRQQRIKQAATQISYQVDLPINEIGLNYRFSSPANFAKAFKIHFGISPSEFRKLRVASRNELLTGSVAHMRTVNDIVPNKNILVRNFYPNVDESLFLREHLKSIDSLEIEVKTMAPVHVAYVRNMDGYIQNTVQIAWKKLGTWYMKREYREEDPLAIGVTHDDPLLTELETRVYDARVQVPDHVDQASGELGIMDCGYLIFPSK